MKLKLKHLAPYLPYELKVNISSNYMEITELLGISTNRKPNRCNVTIQRKNLKYKEKIYFSTIKPILRPLSDLKKEDFKLMDCLYYFDSLSKKWTESDTLCDDVLYWCYSDVQILFKNHYDVFGLIEKGLAISYNDVNTLNKK